LTVILKPGGKLLGEIKKAKGLALDRRLGDMTIVLDK
jgi:hypothetical protein